MDPETIALINAWLRGEIPDPFGVSEFDQARWSGLFAPPEDADEFGTLGWQNDRLTFGKKVNDIMSDPAYIAQLGTGPGGPGPEAFEPTITYEPVKAPGYQNAMFMINSGDPISAYIAEEMMGDVQNGRLGKTSIQVVNELKQAVRNDPELAMALPTYEDDMNPGQPQPDWRAVQNIADSLQKDIIADPTFDSLDPKTGLPANKVENYSEIAQYFRDTNTPNPYETYSPDMLTTESRLRADENASQLRGANKQRVADADRQRAMDMAMIKEMFQGRTMDEPVGRVSPNMEAYGGGSSGPDPAAWLDRNIGDKIEGFFNQDENPAVDPVRQAVLNATTPYWEGAQSGSPARMTEEESARRTLNQRKRGAQAAQAPARVSRERQEARAQAKGSLARNLARVYGSYDKRAESQRREREAMIRELTARGYTPYNNTIRARQAGVFGF